MYDIRFIYNDYKLFTLQVDEHEITNFMESICKGNIYFNNDKSVGFWLPNENLRCIYIVKKLTQEQESQSCQKNLPLEVDNASPN